MGQLFTPKANVLMRGGVLLVVLLIGAVGLAGIGYERSSYATGQGVVVDQPVPFSHAHHVGGLGIDCRYCHSTVENSAFAGVPSTDTCMNCHWQIWTQADLLEPVRESWRTDQPIAWNRVHDLPDFVFFNHSVHIRAGVGCVTCHGRVDRMPLMYKAEPMTMRWCLDCHRDPAPRLRPREQVFNMRWRPPDDRRALGARLMARYGIDTARLTDCTTCHR